MKRIRIIKHRVAALLMSLVIALGCFGPAFSVKARAEALEVANGACTIADMIFSYCASGGVAVMNTSVINEVYEELGSSFGTVQTFVNNGLLTYSNGQYVDTGLSTSIASAIENISSLDIGSLFAQSATQNPAGVALTGAGSLAGIAGSVATTGVLPIAAGVAVTGYCGFQIGTIIANMLGLYDKPIGLGLNINTPENVLSRFNIGDTSSNLYWYFGSQFGMCNRYYAGNYVSVGYKTSDSIWFGIYNNTNSTVSVRDIFIPQYGGNTNVSYHSLSSHGDYFDARLISSIRSYSIANFFNSKSEYDAAKARWISGESQPVTNYSPDVIGPQGNVKGNVENGSYVYPNVTPQVNPESGSVDPSKVSKDDWLSYANSVKENNNVQPDDNADIFSDILSKILINTPTPTPNPDPEPDPNPDPDPNPNPDPETVPAPDLNPYPDNYPVAVPEDVPADKPQPDYTEKQTENETDIIEGDPYTTPDLLNKFPFCIPRDILKIFQKLNSGSREAPHIVWRFNPNNMIDYTFDIDFSMFDNVASLLRLLELLAFIVALGIATRNLILS